MNMIDATTGHSRREERNVAKLLYIAILAAILVGMAFFFLLGQKKTLNPMIQERTTETAPATPSDQ